MYFNRYSNSTARFIYQSIPLVQGFKKTNILLLGNAGGFHDGANLTDTVIVAMLDGASRRVSLVSIPRDLWVEDIKGKINSSYEKGRAQGDGLKFTKLQVSKILGIPIDNAIRVDFNGFIEAIDQLGGIEINIEKSFEDYLYPVAGKENDLCDNKEEERDFSAEEAQKLNIEPGKRLVLITKDGQIATDSAKEDVGYRYFDCRFEHLKFEKGLTRLDGATALKFVRSRHGTNGEGSDFARAKRQQLVLEAIRAKVLSIDSLINPAKITGAIQSLGKSFETDMNVANMWDSFRLVKGDVKITSFVLGGVGGDFLLEHPDPKLYSGGWVLVPRGGDYTLVRNYIQDIINGEIPDGTKKESSPATRSGNIRL